MIDNFFSPVQVDIEEDKRLFSGNITKHTGKFPSLDGIKVAIFGVADSRLGGVTTQPKEAYAAVREELYKLFYKFPATGVADLGDMIPGATAEDTLSAVATTVNELAEAGIASVLLGNSQLLGLGQYAGFDNLNKYTEVTVFDNKVSIHPDELVYRIVSHEPNHLFNLNQLGFQTYLCDDEALQAFDKMYFDTMRLGALRGQPDITEPCLRNSQACIFDFAALKYADAPGSIQSSPNGLPAEEACQVMRYAGISPKMYSLGLYGFSEKADTNRTTAKLVAQMIWFFIEGVAARKTEDPVKEPEKFLQYRTALNEGQHEIVFYKSKATNRWWMEIPHPKNNRENTFPIVVPCSYTDYQTACNNEMPDRWWRVFQKYS